MPDVPPTLRPAEELAARVAEALVSAGLVRESHAERLAGALTSGRMKEQDWRLLIEENLLNPSPPGDA